MTTFDAFLPMDRRAALFNGKELPERTQGSALFADISGFTPLATALAAEMGHRRGAEELTLQINKVFEAIIAQIHHYRGTVIGFSGDAITCWFDRDDGSRALAAALTMQPLIDDLGSFITPGGSEIAIGIKAAAAVGPAHRYLVGNPAVSQMEVLAGSTIDRTAAADNLADQGEVVVDQEIRDNLGDELVSVAERRAADGRIYYVVKGLISRVNPNPWPHIPDLPTDITRRWILPTLYQRLETGQWQFVSDLRLATAVFLKFGGINYDEDDDAGLKLHNFVSWVQSVLERYGAALEHVTLGDKGSYLYLILGAPVAHEDDTARALAAALDLRSVPGHLNYITNIQIGINRGLVYAGIYGGAKRFTYGTQGEAINIAARMMGHAVPGQILVARGLISSVAHSFQFQPLEPLRLKGIDEPWPVAALLGHSKVDLWSADRVASTGEIFGRSAERAELQSALENLASGNSGILIIEGQAGIGKSRLVAHMLPQATQEGVRSYFGEGSAVEQSSPYFAWRRIFLALFDLETAATDPSEVEEAITARLHEMDPEWVRLAPLLSAILPIELADNEITRAMTGDVRADNLHHLLAAVLQPQAHSTPLLLILEDAQWLDSASWNLARIVVREVTPLLLVIVTRTSHTPAPDHLYFQQLPASKTITLQTMPADTILDIVHNKLGVDQLPEPVSALILDKAEGHPFFSEELAYALRDTGHIRIADGRAEMITPAAELQRLTFPDTIHGVITSRIDQVSAGQQLILKVASVIGRIFAYRILHDVNPSGSQDEELQSNLRELEKLDITPLEMPEPELAYIFRHIIMQEVVYSLLTFTQRKSLHRAVAEWYESDPTGDLSAVYPLLAHHWTVAEISDKAIQYALKAGRQALENGAFREAIKHLSDGLEQNKKAGLITDPVELARWHYRLGTAYRQIGQLDQSQAWLMSALDLLGQPFPQGSVRLPASLTAQIGRQLLHRISPAFFQGRAKEAQHPLLMARIYEGLQHVFFYQDQTTASVYCIMRHLNLAEEARPSAQRARSYGAMVNVAGVAGLHKQALGYTRLADEALQLDVPLQDQGLVRQYLSIYPAGAARWAENENNCQAAIAIAETIGNRRRWLENVSCLALALYARGEIERSSQLRQQVLDAAVKEEDRQIQIWGWLELAEIALLHNMVEDALSYLNQAQGIEEGRGLTEEIWLYGLLSVAYLRQEDMAAAETAVDNAHAATSQSTPGAFYLLEALSGMAETNLALWRAAPADAELEKRCKSTVGMLKQFARSFPFSKPRSLLWAGAFAAHRGETKKAANLWQDGLQSARQLHTPYDEGLLLVQLAEHMDQQSAQEKEYRSAAQEIFSALTTDGKQKT
ncbi:MAG: AAA family ATPase [Candidatus Promineifilaceae bacterium]|nr:AAA family ATPase [Candidatus Promineifilaceae bacterium]